VLQPKDEEPIGMDYEAWCEEGKKRFGEDQLGWKFVCPACGNVQCARDFFQYRKDGATPSTAYQCCIGRYMERSKVRDAFGWARPEDGFSKEVERPCNYTINGLFRIKAVTVILGGQEIFAFRFAEPEV